MEMNTDQEWLKDKAAQEDGCQVSAGQLRQWWRCLHCGTTVPSPLTDDTTCECADYYDQAWVRVPIPPPEQRHQRPDEPHAEASPMNELLRSIGVAERMVAECEGEDADPRPWVEERDALRVLIGCAKAAANSQIMNGVWRCQDCGEMVEPMSPKWRMAGDRWQHHHDYPIGHVDATYFGAEAR